MSIFPKQQFILNTATGNSTTMRSVLLRSAAILFTSFLVACGDVPTGSPAPDALSAGPLLSGDCVRGDDGLIRCPPLEPVWGDECDPYHYDCGADDCIQSTGGGDVESTSMQSCPAPGEGSTGGGTAPPPGGEGGGGGSGTGTKPSPQTENLDDHISPQDTVPNCTVAQTVNWAKAYCRASAPTGTRRDAVNAALDRMEQRGPECANLAAQGRLLLGQDRLQVFAPVTGDAGGWGSPTIGVLVADYWIDQFSTTVSADNRNLDHTLSHEIEHVLGREHIDQAGYETPNSRTCSGLSGTSP